MASVFGGPSEESSSSSPLAVTSTSGSPNGENDTNAHSDTFDGLLDPQHENAISPINNNDSLDTDSQILPDSEDDTRPNRFHGKAQKWQKYTAEERGIWASLEQLRADDLSVHLYNAHALKRRKLTSSFADESVQRLSVASRENWYPKEKHAKWTPHAGWTAWPLRPEIVPRPGEKFGVPDDDDEGTMKMRVGLKPSAELEELLGGVMMRRAKEMWVEKGGSVNGLASKDKDKVQGVEVEGREGEDVSNSETEERQFHAAAQGFDAMRTAVLADDDKAKAIIQPTICSILSKFDQLLMKLHHSREGHFNDNYDADDHEAQPRGQRQSRTQSTSRKRSTQKGVHSHYDNSSQGYYTAKHRRTGRPVGRPQGSTKYEKREGESYYAMHKRLREEIRQVRDETESSEDGEELPRSIDDDENDSTNGSMEDEGARRRALGYRQQHSERLPMHNSRETKMRSSSQPQRQHNSNKRELGEHEVPETISEPDENKRVIQRNPRDWSEILGIAAILGWDPKVIDRAAKRCNELFGETMIFNVTGDTNEETNHGIRAGGGSETPNPLSDAVHRISSLQAATNSVDLRLCCPVEECPRHRKEFSSITKMEKHVRNIHKDVTVEATDPQDILVGSVHLDGFLQLIPPRRGWKGKRRKKDTLESHISSDSSSSEDT
ncbi:hypothetical protein NA57DRAFT_71991 [Rhizodiscina lignyota]|uniref:Rrn9 domain-containing protein n=1 Tax=Rhizodiscina lignyota TaxID=1504668 RepID=A0A9P4IN63_9PEZI|nr:hypothetical protein NA57DRAFT_71991 [Rhizodiscina lignyota]